MASRKVPIAEATNRRKFRSPTQSIFSKSAKFWVTTYRTTAFSIWVERRRRTNGVYRITRRREPRKLTQRYLPAASDRRSGRVRISIHLHFCNTLQAKQKFLYANGYCWLACLPSVLRQESSQIDLGLPGVVGLEIIRGLDRLGSGSRDRCG